MSALQQRNPPVFEYGLVLFLYGASNALTPFFRANSQPEFYVWLPVYLLVVVWVLMRPGQALYLASENLIFLSWPVLTMASFFWSLMPDKSLYQGFQMLMTVLAAFLIAARFRVEELMVAVFWSVLAAQVLSVLYFVVDPLEATNQHGNLKGVFPHKNVLGALCVVQYLTACCLLGAGWHRRRMIGVIFLSLGLLILTSSATSLLAFVILTPCILLALACSFRKAFFPVAVGAGIVVLAIVLPIVVFWEINVFAEVLKALGRSPTLTGRTTIWDFGIDAFWDKPWLGYGYNGYWFSNTTTAGTLKLTIKQLVQNFHNNYIEIAVALGAVGLATLIAGLLTAVYRTFRYWSFDLSPVRFWPFGLMLIILVLTASEVPVYVNHSYFQVLLVACAARCAAPSGAHNIIAGSGGEPVNQGGPVRA